MFLTRTSQNLSPYPPRPMSRGELLRYYKKYVQFQKEQVGNVHTTSKPESGKGMRIASYNVHCEAPYADSIKDEGLEHMRRVIRELDADLICLQEVSEPHVLTGSPFFDVHRLFGEYGNAICSRYPLKNLTRHLYSARFSEIRGLMGATVVHPHVGEVRVYNTHLDVFDESEGTRMRQAMAIDGFIQRDLEAFNFSGPVFLMGDFNAVHPSSYLDTNHWSWITQQDAARGVESKVEAISHLFTTGWVDLCRENPPPVTTWSMRRIDYILTKSSLDSLNILPWHHYDVASDHLPVGVDIWI